MRKTPIRAYCPHCYRKAVNAFDVFSDKRPMSGDLSLCGVCGEFSIFDFTRRSQVLRKPDADERRDIGTNLNALRLLQRWQSEARVLQ